MDRNKNFEINRTVNSKSDLFPIDLEFENGFFFKHSKHMQENVFLQSFPKPRDKKMPQKNHYKKCRKTQIFLKLLSNDVIQVLNAVCLV